MASIAHGVSDLGIEALSVPVPREEPRWYAIQTRPRHEKKAVAQLLEKQVETFLPLVSEVHRWSDRRKTLQLPLFPGYAFVRLASTGENCLQVLRTSGVLGFVGVRGKGLPIPDKQVENIRTLLRHDLPCALYPFLRAGQKVRVCGGALNGIEGILVALNADRSLVISIDLIQRSVVIRIKGFNVQPI